MRGKGTAAGSAAGGAAIGVFLVVMIAAAVYAGSLCLLGEALRNVLLFAAASWGSMVQRRFDPGGANFEYGTGKAEQAGLLVISLILIVTGFWVLSESLAALFRGAGDGAPSFRMAIAASAYAAFVCLGVIVGGGVGPARTWSGRRHVLEVLRPSRRWGLAFAVLVLSLLTFSALGEPAGAGRVADGLGGTLVGLVMLATGAVATVESGIDLIDHPLPGGGEMYIVAQLAECGIRPEEVVAIRSRRSGRYVFVELAVDPPPSRSLDDTRRRLAAARAVLEVALEGIDISMKLESRR